MSKPIRVVTFSDRDTPQLLSLQKDCLDKGFLFTVLGKGKPWTVNSFKIKMLSDFLSDVVEDEMLLVLDALDVKILKSHEELLKHFDAFAGDVVFSAEANYYFREKDLNYYYWKFYPRNGTYHYLNSGSFMGSKRDIEALLHDMLVFYDLDIYNEDQLTAIRSDQYVYSRFYVDSYHSPEIARPTISLDTEQEMFGCTGGQMSFLKWPTKNWIHQFLLFKQERKLGKTFGLKNYQLYARNFRWSNGKLINTKTKTSPGVLHLPGSHKVFSIAWRLIRQKPAPFFWYTKWVLAMPVSLIAYATASLQYLIVLYHNKLITDPRKIFRFGHNCAPQMQSARKRIATLLRQKQPFAFVHFNDGEMAFIQKFLENKKDSDWYGRKQHQYDAELGERLWRGITYEQENYLKGIPCSMCHPDNFELARRLTIDSQNTIQAMSIHHNLTLLPILIKSMKGSNVYFFKNERQSLAFFQKMGVEIDPQKVVDVPFLNSYSEYKKLEPYQFEEGSTVIMTCGMLGKILTPVWFKQHPTCTFLTLGSATDDLIQIKHSNFKLYPREYPFTKNTKKYRSFLMGPRKECPECYTT